MATVDPAAIPPPLATAAADIIVAAVEPDAIPVAVKPARAILAFVSPTVAIPAAAPKIYS